MAKGPLIIFFFSILTSLSVKKINQWVGLKVCPDELSCVGDIYSHGRVVRSDWVYINY